MNITMQEGSRGQHIGWLTSIVGGLVVFSLGLELLANQVFGHTDVGTLLWALYLGFWSFILGAIGFLLLAGQWLVEWQRIGQNTNTLTHDNQRVQPTPLGSAVELARWSERMKGAM